MFFNISTTSTSTYTSTLTSSISISSPYLSIALIAFEDEENEGESEVVADSEGWKGWRRRWRRNEKRDFAPTTIDRRKLFSRTKTVGAQPMGMLGSGSLPMFTVDDEVWDRNPLAIEPGPILALHQNWERHQLQLPRRPEHNSPFVRNGKYLPHPYDGEPPTATRRLRLDFCRWAEVAQYIRNLFRRTRHKGRQLKMTRVPSPSSVILHQPCQ
jgi:hypothetical protein